MAAYLLTQDREILAKSTPVHLARDSFMHAIICYTASGAPPLFTGGDQRCCCGGGGRGAVELEPLAVCEASRVALQLQVIEAFVANAWRNSLECRYNFELMNSTASAEVRTGTISKSTKSRQFVVHLSNSA